MTGPEPGLQGYETHNAGEPHIYSGGVPDGYVNDKLERLAVLCKIAKALGATHLGWG